MMTLAHVRACAYLLAAVTLPLPVAAEGLVPSSPQTLSLAKFWATDNVRLSGDKDRLCADVAEGVANRWDALVGISDVRLEAAKSYALSFSASTTGPDAPSGVPAIVQEGKAPWTQRLQVLFKPEKSMQTFGGVLNANVSETAQLVFQMGGQSGSWRLCLSKVALKPEEAATAAASATKPGTKVTPDLPVLAEPVADPVRLNQLGYFVDGPKRATVISDSKTPLEFQLQMADGTILGEGKTEPRGLDTSSGYPVHTADFSALQRVGDGYRLLIDGQASFPFSIGGDSYRKLASDALAWFYPQRSGIAIDGAIAGAAYARPAGHIGVSPNLGDTDVACLSGGVADLLYKDWRCNYRLDVSGGWYDAGDQGKYAVNGGIAVAQLMSAYERALVYGGDQAAILHDGFSRIPERGNGVPDVLDEARWELDFLLKMIVPDGQPLAGMVHHKVTDVAWTPLPMLPNLDPQPRMLHRPSTAATLNVAAVSAQAARLFRPYDPEFADRLLAAARNTYAAAQKHPDLLAPVSDGQQGGGDYSDDDISDENYWAAAELFITTGEDRYRRALRTSPYWSQDVFTNDGFNWRSVAPFARLQLGWFAQKLPARDMKMIRASITQAADRLVGMQRDQFFGQIYAPTDNAYAWGSNQLMLENVIILAAAHDMTNRQGYLQAAREGMDYILGRNALNQSYVTGYGSQFSQNQHSRWYAHQIVAALPSPPVGTLAGGANSTLEDPVAKERLQGCIGQRCYVDDIKSWGTNEMAINWNAALVQAAAILSEKP